MDCTVYRLSSKYWGQTLNVPCHISHTVWHAAAGWDPYTSKNTPKINAVQHHAARFVKHNHFSTVSEWLMKLNWLTSNKYASYPDWHISPHADRPESLSHVVRHCLASLTHLALRLSNALSIFCFLALAANVTLGQSSPKLAEACSRCLSAILQHFSPIVQKVYKMCITEIFHFWPWVGANLWAKVHQKRRWPATHPDLPSCQMSWPYG